MRSLALPHDQIDNHGRDGAASLRFGGMGCRDYRPGRKSGDRRVSSSLAAVSQLGRPSPQRVGRFFASTGELIEFEALRRAGIGAGIAAQVAAQFVTPQGEIPAADPVHQMPSKLADGSEVVHVQSLSQKATLAAGVLNGCQQGMPKNWESLPKRRVE